MARLTKEVIIDSDNRDIGKRFLITEMSPMKSYKFAGRLVIMLISSGWKAPEGAVSAGMAALLGFSLTELISGLKWDAVEPLLDELMQCVEILPNPNDKAVKRDLFDGDIEEISTFATLQQEAFQLHLSFIKPGSPSN